MGRSCRRLQQGDGDHARIGGRECRVGARTLISGDGDEGYSFRGQGVDHPLEQKIVGIGEAEVDH